MIKLFEEYNSNMDSDNEVKNHLSQFPFLKYTLRETPEGLVITFNKDVTLKYISGILAPFKFAVIEKLPVKIMITGQKIVDSFEEFKGKMILGPVESIDIPQLKLFGIKVKTDTGSTASSIHCQWIKIDTQNKTVTFIPLDDTYEEFKNQKITLPLIETVRVQSSNGSEQSRAMVKLDIVIKGKTFETFFSLTNRKELEFPILLGRDALAGKFLIDSSKIDE